MPLLAMGTYKFDTARKGTLVSALEMGYRHIDTAYFYKNEDFCGQEIGQFLKANPDVKREDLFVTTKLSSNHNTVELCVQACKDQVKELGLEYVDLYLIHAPWSKDPVTDEYKGQG